MVWKSNLSGVEQELIEEFGTTQNLLTPTSNQGNQGTGGITSNRRTKNIGGQTVKQQTSVKQVSEAQRY